MKRMNKNYNITEQTNAIIKAVAEDLSLPDSYALDNICLSYWRMAHKNDHKPLPTPTNQKRIYKKQETQYPLLEGMNKETWIKQYQPEFKKWGYSKDQIEEIWNTIEK